MFDRSLRLVGGALLAFVVLGSPPAIAHHFPLSTVMTALVKIEPTQAHLVLRTPLQVLSSDMSRFTVAFPATGPAIDLAAAGPAIQGALGGLGQEIAIWEDGVRLVPSSAIGRLSLPSNRSFERYDRAVAHVVRPMAPGETIISNQGFFDAHFTYPIISPKSRFAVQMTLAPGLPEEYLKLVVRFLSPEGSWSYVISNQSGRVHLNPTWYQAAGAFVALGIRHILSSVDSLLFLLCLIIPFRRLRGLIPVAAAFAVVHSVTLIGSAYGPMPAEAWFRLLVETAIAASIVYVALEDIVVTDPWYRWLISGIFGLVYGLGFSYAFKDGLQFAGSHALVALLAFNLGIVLGQIAVLLGAYSALRFLVWRPQMSRVSVIILSALLAHTAWHRMLDRGASLWLAQWPALDAAAVVTGARWAVAVLLVAGAAWLIGRALGRQPVRQPGGANLGDLGLGSPGALGLGHARSSSRGRAEI